MAKAFFREQYHYTVDEISQRLETTVEEARHLLGILKKYGIVKAVRAPKPGYEELPGQDMVLADVLEYNPNVEYAFGFVGVVMLEGHVFKCYPKYIFSTETPMLQLKKVLKVIKKYNEKEQLVYLYNGEDNGRIFNRLAVSLYLLEDYFLYGVYTNSHEIVETNGIGEILWDKTINETAALIRDNRPYYVQMQTRSMEDNDADYFRRLHECVLSQCSTELEAAGILELFDIGQVNLTSLEIGDFGDTDDVKYRLEREMRMQFVTRRQMLLKTLYTYISNEKMNMESSGLSLYGTGNFEQVWEKVCADNFGNMLHEKIGSLPLGVCSEYAGKREKELISMIDRPVWHKNHPAMSGGKTGTLKPDLIRIFPCGGQGGYCFGIYDAKYYCIDFGGEPPCGRVTGQPGVEDITKQYLYQLAYDDFVQKQGYRYVQNAFLCPQEEAEPDYGYVEMEMLRTVGNKTLENIMVVKLCAEEMYDLYLANKRIEKITDYIPYNSSG